MFRKCILSLTLLLYCTCALAEPLVFGIVPQQSAKTLAKNWTPFLDYLSRQTDIAMVFATAKDIPTFEKRLAQGTYDIAYMNPYHYVVMSESANYQALARQKDKAIQGIIVVKQNSDIETLQDLSGQTMAFPAPAAFAASIIPQLTLKQNKIPINPQYVSSHDSVYFSVARDVFSAGGGVYRTFNAVDNPTREVLKVLWQSPPYTPHAIATSDKIKAETREKILKALLAMNNSNEAEPLLQGIAFKGFVAANDEDWDDVRELGIATELEQTAEVSF